MNMLYEAQLPPDQPQTHALVIGVNAYPHLPGGNLYNSQRAPKHFGLSQLTSPVISATALTDWLLTQHYNPAKPLGSVDLLLSPATYVPSAMAAAKLGKAPGSQISVNGANFSSIKEATTNWYLRANKHRDNITLFYFCGHGLASSDRYLLSADFGADLLDWTANIIDFTTTYNRMVRCRAKTQCFFLDACRDNPDELNTEASQRSIGQPLIGPQSGSILDRDAPIYHAAAPGKSALGPPGEESYFTQALLDSLNGLGASQRYGSAFGYINHNSLGTALRELINRLSIDKSLELQCESGGSSLLPQPDILHLVSLPLKVLMVILCEPSKAHRVARLFLEDSTGTRIPRLIFDEKPWRLIVTEGKCVIEAEFDAMHLHQNGKLEVIAFPPLCQPMLAIEDR